MDKPKIKRGNFSIINLSSVLTLRIKKNVFLTIFNVDNTNRNKYMLLSISISN